MMGSWNLREMESRARGPAADREGDEDSSLEEGTADVRTAAPVLRPSVVEDRAFCFVFARHVLDKDLFCDTFSSGVGPFLERHSGCLDEEEFALHLQYLWLNGAPGDAAIDAELAAATAAYPNPDSEPPLSPSILSLLAMPLVVPLCAPWLFCLVAVPLVGPTLLEFLSTMSNQATWALDLHSREYIGAFPFTRMHRPIAVLFAFQIASPPSNSQSSTLPAAPDLPVMVTALYGAAYRRLYAILELWVQLGEVLRYKARKRHDRLFGGPRPFHGNLPFFIFDVDLMRLAMGEQQDSQSPFAFLLTVEQPRRRGSVLPQHVHLESRRFPCDVDSFCLTREYQGWRRRQHQLVAYSYSVDETQPVSSPADGSPVLVKARGRVSAARRSSQGSSIQFERPQQPTTKRRSTAGAAQETIRPLSPSIFFPAASQDTRRSSAKQISARLTLTTPSQFPSLAANLIEKEEESEDEHDEQSESFSPRTPTGEDRPVLTTRLPPQDRRPPSYENFTFESSSDYQYYSGSEETGSEESPTAGRQADYE
ncbi:unnamed protein product [Vitrella brassicaformis CCMP3155]|uniref:Uncharacterized protein n=1 Tax=Vitrella brassicaformis (strain CCMP3155) TaxID=1169540 RepID=A0A0G4H4B9_VITBC|nr:unnamed protein product [Vitrella brassicaformis CCMP3155]|eukprot:CEM38612.1 unnamed protein product [Vitrella brassicaformis CCMP3155]